MASVCHFDMENCMIVGWGLHSKMHPPSIDITTFIGNKTDISMFIGKKMLIPLKYIILQATLNC
jgi:hypothetical protein